MEKDYYVDTPGGYYQVNNRVKKYGYKVIGECKLWKPKPTPISDEDVIFIKQKLSSWLNTVAKVNPPVSLGKIDSIPNAALKKQLKYVFTYFGPGLRETDAYLITFGVENGTREVNIYIPKLSEGIDYPFKDENWNKSISYNDK